MKNLIKVPLISSIRLETSLRADGMWTPLPSEKSRAYMMQQFSTKIFLVNLFHAFGTDIFESFSGLNASFHLWKMSGWGCIITAINPHCCVIFSKTYISPHVCGQFFFGLFCRYTVILHKRSSPQAIYISPQKRHLSVQERQVFLSLSSNSYQAARHTKAAKWKSLLVD